MRMRIAVIIIGLLILGGGIYLGIGLFRGSDIETAIEMYEDRDFDDAIVMLNSLSNVLDYEKAEKVYYYRCMAINGFAEEVEKDYEDEIKAISDPDIEVSEKKRVKQELDEKISEINRKIDGDLFLLMGKKGSRIISRGKFYDEFVSRYNGSRYLEDLDFEEVLKVERTEPIKLMNAISNFYSRYPNTSFISQLVKLLFRGFQKGNIQIKGKEDFLKKLVIHFGRKYPTSSEFHKIFICTGEGVNLRNSPGLKGGVVGKIASNEILIQLEKSMDTFQIGDVRDYWYRIASLKGLKGWIFGKFLDPLDVSRFKEEDIKERWSFEEYFNEWSDSNTPEGWMHIENSNKGAISFTVKGGDKTIKLNSLSGSSSGLFKRISVTRSFAISAKARYIKGDAFIVFAYAISGDRFFFIRLMEEQVDVSGRKIPLHTSDWHVYRLESEGGRYARLSVDGEIISSRIKPAKSSSFKNRGIYCLYSSANEGSSAEMEYIKVRN